MSGLEVWIEKGLAQAIEDSGKSRNKISLKDICNSAPSVFGEKGDIKRRAIQHHFANIKRKSIRSWALTLDNFGIPHGAATILELRNLDSQPSPESVATEASPPSSPPRLLPRSPPTPSPPSRTEASHMASDEDILTPLKSAFRNLSVASPQVMRTPPPSSTRGNMSYTPGTPSPWHENRSSVDESSDISKMIGSKFNPHVINVNIEYPEMNLMFDVQFVKDFKHGDFVRSGFHIRAQTSVKDIDTWAATMYQGPGYENHSAVLIKAPSRSSWFDNVADYHRRTGYCKETKEAHVTTASMIKGESHQIILTKSYG
jgi:hypothetical protein